MPVLCFLEFDYVNLQLHDGKPAHEQSADCTDLINLLLLQNSVLAVPHSQWQERELKPFSINGRTTVEIINKNCPFFHKAFSYLH